MSYGLFSFEERGFIFKGVFGRCLQTYLVLNSVDFAEMEAHFPFKHKILEKSRFQIHPYEKEIFQLKNAITSLVLGNKHYSYRSSWQGKQIHLVFRVLQMKLRISKSVKPSAFWTEGSTCQACRFRNWGVSQTQILSLPDLPFSELVTIKHTPK